MSISIFPTNLGRYNEGYLVGAWVELPMDHDELWKTINEVCRVDRFHEEIFITDYENDMGLNLSFGEYESIDDINALAAALEDLQDYELEAFDAYTDYNGCYSTIQMANIAMDVDNIQFYQYECDGSWMTNEERYGRTLVAQNYELQKVLVDNNIEDYFDFEAYGRDDGDVYLTDEGYLVLCGNDPDTDWYDAHSLLSEKGFWLDEDEEEVA